jgi:hypothetical protein
MPTWDVSLNNYTTTRSGFFSSYVRDNNKLMHFVPWSVFDQTIVFLCEAGLFANPTKSSPRLTLARTQYTAHMRSSAVRAFRLVRDLTFAARLSMVTVFRRTEPPRDTRVLRLGLCKAVVEMAHIACPRSEDGLYWLSWFSSVPQGKCLDNTLN